MSKECECAEKKTKNTYSKITSHRKKTMFSRFLRVILNFLIHIVNEVVEKLCFTYEPIRKVSWIILEFQLANFLLKFAHPKPQADLMELCG